MIISLSIFYYIYLSLVGVFIIFSFFNLYHLWRFGYMGAGNIFVITCYLALSGMILVLSFFYIFQINWQEGLDLLPQNGPMNFP